MLHCYSPSVIYLSKNSTFYSRSKHIDDRYYLIRDVMESNSLKLEKIHANDNPSDMMTKALSKDKHEKCRSLSSMANHFT